MDFTADLIESLINKNKKLLYKLISIKQFFFRKFF